MEELDEDLLILGPKNGDEKSEQSRENEDIKKWENHTNEDLVFINNSSNSNNANFDNSANVEENGTGTDMHKKTLNNLKEHLDLNKDMNDAISKDQNNKKEVDAQEENLNLRSESDNLDAFDSVMREINLQKSAEVNHQKSDKKSSQDYLHPDESIENDDTDEDPQKSSNTFEQKHSNDENNTDDDNSVDQFDGSVVESIGDCNNMMDTDDNTSHSMAEIPMDSNDDNTTNSSSIIETSSFTLKDFLEGYNDENFDTNNNNEVVTDILKDIFNAASQEYFDMISNKCDVGKKHASQLLGKCCEVKTKIKNLTEMKKTYPDFWLDYNLKGDNARATLEENQLILNRLGVPFSEPHPDYEQLTICERHSGQLVEHYQVEKVCQSCGGDTGDLPRRATPRQAKHFQEFPDLFGQNTPGVQKLIRIGLPLCANCMRAINAFIREGRSPHAQKVCSNTTYKLNNRSSFPISKTTSFPTPKTMLFDSEVTSESPEAPPVHPRNESGFIKYMWYAIDPENPSIPTESENPPDKVVSLCEAENPTHLMDMQFALELNMTMKSQKEYQAGYVETLRKLFTGLTNKPIILQPFEFFHHTNICYRLFDFLVMKLSENINYRGKIVQFFSIPFYKLIFIPNKDAIKTAYNKPERLVIIFTDRDDNEVTVCLTCPDMSCTGCGEEKKVKMVDDLGAGRHMGWLGRCCRICGTTDFKNVHYHGTVPKLVDQVHRGRKTSGDVKEETKEEQNSSFDDEKCDIKKVESDHETLVPEESPIKIHEKVSKADEQSECKDIKHGCIVQNGEENTNGMMEHCDISVEHHQNSQINEIVKMDTNCDTSLKTGESKFLNGDIGFKKDKGQLMEVESDVKVEGDIKSKLQCPNFFGKLQGKGIYCKFNHTEEIKRVFGVNVTLDDPLITPSRLCHKCYSKVIQPMDDLKDAEDAKLEKLVLWIKTFAPHNIVNCLDCCGYSGLESWARVSVGETFRVRMKQSGKVATKVSEALTGIDKKVTGFSEEVTGSGKGVTGSSEGMAGPGEGEVRSGEIVTGSSEGVTGNGEKASVNGEGVSGPVEGVSGPGEGVTGPGERASDPSEEVTGFSLMLSYECIPTLKILTTGFKSKNSALIKKADFKLTVKNAVEISLTLAKARDSELYLKLVRRGILQGPDRATFVVKAHDFRTCLERFSANFSEAVKKDKLCRSAWEKKLKEVLHLPYYCSEVMVKKRSDGKKFYFILKVLENKLVCTTCTLDVCNCEIPQTIVPLKKGLKDSGPRTNKYVGKLQSMSRKLGLSRTMTNAEYVHLMDTGVWKEAKEIPPRKRLTRNVEKSGKIASECDICKIRFIHEKVFLFHLQSCNFANNGKICCPTCRRTYDTELGIIKHLQLSEFCGSTTDVHRGIKSGRHNSTDSELASLASSSDVPDLARIKVEDAEEDPWDNISVICEVEDDEDEESGGSFKLMMRMEEDIWVTVDELLTEGGVGWRSEETDMNGMKTIILFSPHEDTSVSYQSFDTEDQGGKLVVVKGRGVLGFCESGWSVISESMACVVYDKRTVRRPELHMVTREADQDAESLMEDGDGSGAGQFMFQRPTSLEICVGCQASFPSRQEYKAHTRVCEHYIDTTKPWSCYGCGQKFQHETPMLKHISKCKFCSLPEDLRNPVRTEDGKIGCLGCRKTWKDIGQCYYKHVTRGCRRVKPGKFPCKKCRSKFSTSNSLQIHMDQCRGHKIINIETAPLPRKSRNSRNARVQASPRKKRHKSESSEESDDSDTPLSKRIRPNSSVKNEIQETTEYHEPVCKIGSYKCPICGTRFQLNQPYGRHVQSLGCSKARLDKEIPKYNKMLFVTIHPGTHDSDSTIAYSQVPSLKMLCRGFFTESGFPPEIELPSPTIKEAIEMNYSIKHSDSYKELDREERWRYFHHRNIFSMVGTSKDMISSCISILKIINLFENKIRLARASQVVDSELARNWNDKLSEYLRIHYHDNINTTNIVNNFRVIEYAKDGKLACLCLLCPALDCIGCFTRKMPVKQVSQTKKQAIQYTKKQPNQYNTSKKRPFYGNQFTNSKGKSSSKPSVKSEFPKQPEPKKKQPNQYTKVKNPPRQASPGIVPMTAKQLYQARYRLKQKLNRVGIPTENEYYYHAHTGKFVPEAGLEKQHAELSKKLGNRQLTFQEFLQYKFETKMEPFDYYSDEYDSPPEDPEDDEYIPQSSRERRRHSRDSLTNNTSHKQKNAKRTLNVSKVKAEPKPSKKESTECFYCQYCESAFQTQMILQRHLQLCQNNPENLEAENMYMDDNDLMYEEMEPNQEEMSSLCTVESYCSLQTMPHSTMPLIISPRSLQAQIVDGADPLDGLDMEQDPLGDCILPD